MSARPPATQGRDATQSDPWLSCEPHLNARLLEPVLQKFEGDFGRKALEDLANTMGTTLAVLSDPDRWFSTQLFLELLRQATRDSGDPDLPYKCGRDMVRPGRMGSERLIVRGLANPTMAYSQFQRISARMSRVTHWDIEIHRRGRATATLELSPEAVDGIEFCRNRLAVLEAIPETFSLPPARVDHPACIHRGDPSCVYELHWVERNPWLQRGWLATGALGLGALALAAFDPAFIPYGIGLTGLVGLATGIGSAFSYRQVEEGAQSLTREAMDEYQQLLERNDARIAELQAIQEIGRAAARPRDEAELIDVVLEKLCAVMGYDRALLLRTTADGLRLGEAHTRGFGPLTPAASELTISTTPDSHDPRLFGNIAQAGVARLVHVDQTYLDTLKPDNRRLLADLQASSFVAAPVHGGTEAAGSVPVGLLVVGRVGDSRPLHLRDRDLVQSVADTLGTALSNVRHLARVREELLINQKFRQYLPHRAAEEILADPAARLRLGGERRHLAVMFVDIAGFTATSAALEPEAVVQGLNAWFALTDPIIEAHGGILDKRMGDGLLVVFLHEEDAPPERHPVLRAVAAAREMQLTLERCRAGLAAAAPGFGDLSVRHAIHYGHAIVGNMGSERRMEYTAIGDAVNTCARLEELTPAGSVWVTGEAVAAAPRPLVGASLACTVTLRGRPSPTEAWEVAPQAVKKRGESA